MAPNIRVVWIPSKLGGNGSMCKPSGGCDVYILILPLSLGNSL